MSALRHAAQARPRRHRCDTSPAGDIARRVVVLQKRGNRFVTGEGASGFACPSTCGRGTLPAGMGHEQSPHRRLSRWATVTMALSAVALVAAVLAARYSPVTGEGWTYQSCAECGAIRIVRVVERAKLFSSISQKIVQGNGVSSHRHSWRDGVPGGVAVEPGQVLLVRQGGALGAVIMGEYDTMAHQMPFSFAYRDDGDGTLDPSDPAVTTGSGEGRVIEFGPFRFPFDLMADTQGGIKNYFVSYPRQPHEQVQDDDLAIAATDATTFEELKTCDPRWDYRASAVDSGAQHRQP